LRILAASALVISVLCYFPLYCILIITGKRPSDSRNAGPARKCKKIDLEQKIKMLKYEGGHSLSSVAHELDFATSTVKSILNDITMFTTVDANKFKNG
jgi:hypothetical protein